MDSIVSFHLNDKVLHLTLFYVIAVLRGTVFYYTDSKY